jgi:hypothetical protein
MKALTVQQPWAWAIFNGKNIENRTQLWKYRGPLAIHAGKRWSERGGNDDRVLSAFIADQVRTGLEPKYADMLRSGLLEEDLGDWYGAILGTVELVDVHPDAGCCRPWGESAYVEHGGHERRQIVHLVLENARPLAEPIPCTGALGLWTPPADIIAQLEREGRL